MADSGLIVRRVLDDFRNRRVWIAQDKIRDCRIFIEPDTCPAGNLCRFSCCCFYTLHWCTADLRLISRFLIHRAEEMRKERGFIQHDDVRLAGGLGAFASRATASGQGERFPL